MARSFKTFVFDHYHFDAETKTIFLNYNFDHEVKFEEKFVLDAPILEDYHQEALDEALFGLWVMAGVSYFKAALPPQIEFKKGGLSAFQRDFFYKCYLHGLGEFFYTNQIDPREKINFPDPIEKDHRSVVVDNLKDTIVPMGGGKDSIITAEWMKELERNSVSWIVKPTPLLENVCKVIGRPVYRVHRTIAPELLRLNKEGALNGHVPITAILSFLSVVTAILTGKKYIAFSNESSAGEGNVQYFGMEINHQYSKTLEFEVDFREYLQTCITPSIQYYSLLRDQREIDLVHFFCARYFPLYKDVFSSCNRNFHLDPKTHSQTPLWCGKCPKCAFVFTMMAPYLLKRDVIDLFGGNLFLDPGLQSTFQDLLGRGEHKPFECVGEVAEVKEAMEMALKTGEWEEVEAILSPGTQ